MRSKNVILRARTVLAMILGFVSVVLHCSGQEITTVAQCRAYREAWMTSVTEDIQRLSVKVLRAGEMNTCGEKIDIAPIKADLTKDEAMRTVSDELAYPTLASNYYQEAFNRAAWFMENKHLTHEFIADDENGKIVSSVHGSGR